MSNTVSSLDPDASQRSHVIRQLFTSSSLTASLHKCLPPQTLLCVYSLNSLRLLRDIIDVSCQRSVMVENVQLLDLFL